jgi:diadenosine tetraphosphate (Ap4A) HIT family hydrolase
MTDIKPSHEFQAKFRTSELAIRAYPHWTWSLRPRQVTLGASIILLNRHARCLGNLEPHEGAELSIVMRDVEFALREAFEFDRINYLAMMMFDAQVHFHVFPRYQSQRTAFQTTWIDESWPSPPDLSGEASPPRLLGAIQTRLTARNVEEPQSES